MSKETDDDFERFVQAAHFSALDLRRWLERHGADRDITHVLDQLESALGYRPEAGIPSRQMPGQ